jgi:hypothetical protein
MWKRGAMNSSLETRITPTTTWSIIIASATMVTIQTHRPRSRRARHATSASAPATALPTIATYPQRSWKSRRAFTRQPKA